VLSAIDCSCSGRCSNFAYTLTDSIARIVLQLYHRDWALGKRLFGQRQKRSCKKFCR
jgi:hypothetical protein